MKNGNERNGTMKTGTEIKKAGSGYSILYLGKKLGHVFKNENGWSAWAKLDRFSSSQLSSGAVNVGEDLRTRKEAVTEIELSSYAENRMDEIEEGN